jgi:hypothetical protein
MAQYTVTFDQKCTIWDRNTVTVVADSLQEAIDKVAKAAEKHSWVDSDPDITYEESSELYETAEPLSILENAGADTIEILDPSTREVIWDNVNKYSKSYKF